MDALARVESIPGWLLPEDAEALYALALESHGPILEIGTYRGKSAILMALALVEAGGDEIVFTVDFDRRSLDAAASHARERDVAEKIVFVRGTSVAFARAYPHVRPAVTFVDGDHSQSGVGRDLAAVQALVPVGGRLVFHDFNDPRNGDPDCAEVKVRPAVESSWVSRDCELERVAGACGVYVRRRVAPMTHAAAADLAALDDLRDQWRYRVRLPAGRAWRRIRDR